MVGLRACHQGLLLMQDSDLRSYELLLVKSHLAGDLSPTGKYFAISTEFGKERTALSILSIHLDSYTLHVRNM